MLEAVEFTLIGPEIVYEALENVRLKSDRLKMSQSQQKSYAENRKRNLEFEVGDMVYLKIVPMKGGFGKKGKRSPYNVGPYDILKLVENVDYELRLPIYLTHVHSVFHVSMLKK